MTSVPRPADNRRVVGELSAAVLAATGEGVVICDEQMRYVWVNPAGCALMGYRLEELVGRDFLVNFPERMHASMTQAYQAQLAGETGTFTGTLLRRDGTEVDMTWSNMSFDHDGRRYGAAIFRPNTAASTARVVTGLADAAEVTARGGAMLEVLDELARSAVAHTRALGVALEVVDPDMVVRRGGRAGMPQGFGPAQVAISAAGGRIPFIDVWYTGRPVILADARTRLRHHPPFELLCDALDEGMPNWQSAVFIAMGYRGRVLGGLCAFFPTGVPAPTEDELAYLTAVADYGALVIEHTNLQSSSERTAALEERARLARDLHDSVTQALFSIKLHARSLTRAFAQPEETATSSQTWSKAVADVAAITELAGTATAEMRALIFELRLDALADHGLEATLLTQTAVLAEQHGVVIDVTGPGTRLPLAPAAEEHAYRIAMEAVTNSLKHAHAQHVEVHLTDLGDVVTVTVRDDGTGFDPTRRPAADEDAATDLDADPRAEVEPDAGPAAHFGLHTMRERAHAIGGHLDLTTAPGQGTTVRLTVPATGIPRSPSPEAAAAARRETPTPSRLDPAPSEAP